MKQSIAHASGTRRIRKTCAFLVIGLLAVQAQADEAALYGPSAPKGSAFVRLYNAGNQEVSASVGNTQLSDVGPLGSSDFSFLPGGDYSAKLGTQSLTVKLNADQYYTLVNLPGSPPKLVEEPAFKNKQKALLRVQNLTDSELSLKTADGKTPVVDKVKALGRGEREINPLNVKLALFSGTEKVADLKPVSLARGEAVCLYVTGSAGKFSPVWVKRPAATQ